MNGFEDKTLYLLGKIDSRLDSIEGGLNAQKEYCEKHTEKVDDRLRTMENYQEQQKGKAAGLGALTGGVVSGLIIGVKLLIARWSK